MPSVLGDGLTIAAVLPREDARDVFIRRVAKALRELGAGAVVGTASLRRQAIVKRLRPDLEVVPIRANVETPLRKLDERAGDPTPLAPPGFNRPGLTHPPTSIFPVAEFLPALAPPIVSPQPP